MHIKFAWIGSCATYANDKIKKHFLSPLCHRNVLIDIEHYNTQYSTLAEIPGNEDLCDSLDSVKALLKVNESMLKSLAAQEEKMKALGDAAQEGPGTSLFMG